MEHGRKDLTKISPPTAYVELAQPNGSCSDTNPNSAPVTSALFMGHMMHMIKDGQGSRSQGAVRKTVQSMPCASEVMRQIRKQRYVHTRVSQQWQATIDSAKLA